MLRHHSLLALVFVSSVTAGMYAALQTPDAVPLVSAVRVERATTDQIVPDDSASVRTRRAAGFLALIPGGLLFFLYLYRRRPYLLAWTAAWLLLALMLFITTVGADLMRDGEAQHGGRLVGLARGFGVGGAVLLCLAIRSFRRSWHVPRRLLTLVAALLLGLVAAIEVLGLSAALTITYAALGLTYGAGAFMYVNAGRRVRMMGPVAIGLGMLGVASTYAYAVVLVARGLNAVEAPNLTVFISVAWHGLIALGMHLMVFEDMSAELQAINADLAKTQRELQHAAITDPLTGCHNRRFFDEVVERELERQRRHGVPLALLFIDCDNLKAINDRLGHNVGDEALRLIADVIRIHVRRSDFAFRWGGDEFLVLMACDEPQALEKARDIQHAFAAHPLMHRLPAGAGLSVGCVSVPVNTRDMLPLIREVDARMYANKRQGV